jgi:hypothetical protein
MLGGNPRHSSLDAISIYLGYKSWYDFQQIKGIKKTKPVKKTKKQESQLKKYIPFLGVVLLFVIIYLTKNIIYNPAKSNMNKDFTFETTDTFGIIPHSVELRFDIRNLNGNGFMVRNVEKDNLKKIDKNDTALNLFYRKGGIKELSLLQGKTILKTTKVYIVYDNWTAEINSDNKPTHLYEENQMVNDSTLTIPVNEFKQDVNLAEFKEIKYISGFPANFKLDKFRLVTRYRYVPINGYDACLKSCFTLLGKEGYISIPFAHNSCLKGLTLDIENENNNYLVIQHSELYTYNNPDWIHLQIEKDNDSISVYRNSKLIFNGTCKKTWGDYLMTKYIFLGNGEIDYLRIYNKNDSVLYRAEFSMN